MLERKHHGQKAELLPVCTTPNSRCRLNPQPTTSACAHQSRQQGPCQTAASSKVTHTSGCSLNDLQGTPSAHIFVAISRSVAVACTVGDFTRRLLLEGRPLGSPMPYKKATEHHQGLQRCLLSSSADPIRCSSPCSCNSRQLLCSSSAEHQPRAMVSAGDHNQ